jgi:DNA polymerase III epsilon subunit-like protein
MLYTSIDLETTGIDKDKHQVLSIGAIVEDTRLKLPYDQIPKFHGVILRHEITGSPRALTMNKGLIEMIGNYIEGSSILRETMTENYGKIFYTEEQIIPELFRFLFRSGCGYSLINDMAKTMDRIDGVLYPQINGKTKPITINVAGKNFGTFDKPFLMSLPWFQKLINIRQRILDPAILCVDWKNDEALPNLTECKNRCGIEGIVTHNALEDAWDVIEVLRKSY